MREKGESKTKENVKKKSVPRVNSQIMVEFISFIAIFRPTTEKLNEIPYTKD